MTDPITVTETWTGADDDPWDPSVWPIIRNAEIGSIVTPKIAGNMGSLETAAGSGARVVCFTTPTVLNFELIVKLQRPDDTLNSYTEIGYRITSNITSGRPHGGYVVWIWHQNGDVLLYKDGLEEGIDHFPSGPDLTDTDPWWFRLRVKGTSHRARWWRDGDSEPPTWMLDTTDASYTAPGRMYLGLGDDTVEAAHVLYDDYTMTEILPPDPGINIGGSLDEIVGLYTGDHVPIVATYIGATAVVVP